MASLAPTFGRGAMTNTWQDIKNANVVVVMGGNAAEAHPCGFKWVIEAKIENNAKLVVIDPRFTRTASVADVYAPIRPGTDIAFLSGVIRYLLEKDKIQHEYVRAYTNAGLIVKDGFGFEDGLFTGYDEDSPRATTSRAGITSSTIRATPRWTIRWQHPRCVINLLRKHVDRYTPEMVSRICGTPQDKYLQVCELFATHRGARQGADEPVCARLDAAFGRLAEHPHDGDGPAAAGQYRRGGRRDERAARPFQHPGTDRYRTSVEPDARLSRRFRATRSPRSRIT